jgi:hypothetical protein
MRDEWTEMDRNGILSVGEGWMWDSDALTASVAGGSAEVDINKNVEWKNSTVRMERENPTRQG